MAKRRQLALMSVVERREGGAAPLGSLRRVKELLAPFNTAPDGSPTGQMGTHRLYGPGMVVDLPSGHDEVMQALVTMVEEDIAWPVLSKLCKALQWKMVDLESGRSFG